MGLVSFDSFFLVFFSYKISAQSAKRFLRNLIFRIMRKEIFQNLIKFYAISAYITITLSTCIDSVWLAVWHTLTNRWLVCLTERCSVCLSVDQLVGRAYFAFFVYFHISTPVHRLSVSLHLSSEMYISRSVALRDPRLLHV